MGMNISGTVRNDARNLPEDRNDNRNEVSLSYIYFMWVFISNFAELRIIFSREKTVRKKIKQETKVKKLDCFFFGSMKKKLRIFSWWKVGTCNEPPNKTKNQVRLNTVFFPHDIFFSFNFQFLRTVTGTFSCHEHLYTLL